jgi:thioesterase III
MIHTIEIKVRGYHIDMFGHVNNARYLEFLEEARWAAVEESMDVEDFLQNGYTFNVVNININYRRPAVPNDVLIIETGLGEVGSRSAVIRQTVKLKDTNNIIADADVTFVIFDVKEKKAAALKGELLSMLKKI